MTKRTQGTYAIRGNHITTKKIIDMGYSDKICVFGYNADQEQDKANMEFIVKACNYYSQLEKDYQIK